MRFDSEYANVLTDEFLENVRRRDVDHIILFEYEGLHCVARHAARFDCSRLHEDFLIETGLDREAELMQTGDGLRLPHDDCLLEFNSIFVSVGYSSIQNGDESDDFVVLRALPGSSADLTDEQMSAEVEIHSRRSARLMDRGPEPSPLIDRVNTVDDDLDRRGTLLALGVITLMEERLLREEARGGLSPKANRKRLQKGRPTIRAYSVLTLNLAETKRRTRGVALAAHESPRLHWRRGHWRTLGRLSEFEHRTWVRRCLVGDPSKGFAAKHYALAWHPTIH